MATVEERVLANTRAGGHEISVRRLFLLFSAHARKTYKYSAVKIRGNEGNTLLARPENEVVTVDCASLADAFVELANSALGEGTAKSADVGYGDGFATAEGSRCFDPTVVGNIRRPGQTWAETGRCVFKSHYFVETGTDTRWFLDPCMFTSYTTKDEVMSWKFVGGGGCFRNSVKRVIGDPSIVLLRIPAGDSAPKPNGFESGLVIFKATDFTKDALLATGGRRLNPGWSDAKYETNRDAALTTINKLLRERAGVNADWTANDSDPPDCRAAPGNRGPGGPRQGASTPDDRRIREPCPHPGLERPFEGIPDG